MIQFVGHYYKFHKYYPNVYIILQFHADVARHSFGLV